MAKSTIPKAIQNVIGVFFSNCPVCREETQDRRFKQKLVSHCRLRRYSRTTLVQECKRCGVRYSITWKTIVNVLEKLAQIECDSRVGKDKKECKNFYGKGADWIRQWLEIE